MKGSYFGSYNNQDNKKKSLVINENSKKSLWL